MAYAVALVMLFFVSSQANAKAPSPPSPLCLATDTSWISVDEYGNPFLNLNPKLNTATGYIDDRQRSKGTTTTSFSRVRIVLGFAHESTFVVVNSSETFAAGMATSYPLWGSSHSCQHTGTPLSIDLTGTPFALFNGSAAFQEYEEAVSPSHVKSANCDSTNKVCSASCGGWCGGCKAGPKDSVLLSVADARQFECGVAAFNRGIPPKYLCRGSQCVVSVLGEVSKDVCEDVCLPGPPAPPMPPQGRTCTEPEKDTTATERGHDIDSFTTNDPQACKQRCFDNSKCTAYNHIYDWKVPQCFLHGSPAVGGVPGEGQSSGTCKTVPMPTRTCTEPEKDTTATERGHDIDSFTTSDPQACRQRCFDNSKCTAYNHMYDWEVPQCFLHGSPAVGGIPGEGQSSGTCKTVPVPTPPLLVV